MNKLAADEIVINYMRKIFGFAVSKTFDTNEAEELSSRIALELYASLLKCSAVNNPNGYVWKICEHVYAKFVSESVRGAHISIDDVNEAQYHRDDDLLSVLTQSEMIGSLRAEIAYLGKTRRDIIVLHYYKNMKLADISDMLNIPAGTVKWHLHEAKNELKERLEMSERKPMGSLGVNPIKLCSMGHSGSPGSMGDTSNFLSSVLTQNIAYAAYHTPRNVKEISEELGVSPLFVEGEVDRLEEYGFLDKLSDGRYRTNIYISEDAPGIADKEHELYVRYAKKVAEIYAPKVFDAFTESDKTLYIPDGDQNLLNWLAFIMSCGSKLQISNDLGLDYSKYNIKRKDGGEYVASATVETNIKSQYDLKRYGVCGDMTRGSDKGYCTSSWQINTYYDSREGGWRNNLNSDYDYLYEVITGKITKDDVNLAKYKRLYDKGYLINENGTDKVNIIMSCDKDSYYGRMPAMPVEFTAVGAELDEEIYKLKAPQYPEHMRDLCRMWTTNCLSGNAVRMRAVEILLAESKLRLPTEAQKAGLNTIMFSDVLPK